MIDIIIYFISGLFLFVWFILTTFYKIIIPGIVIGFLILVISKKMNPPRIPVTTHLHPQEPAIYYNQFGHLTKVDVDEDHEEEIREYFVDMDITENNFRGGQENDGRR